MPKVLLLAMLVLCLGGCQTQIALGVEQMTETIPLMLGDNVVDNLVRIMSDPDAIVAQVALKESVSTAQNGLSYGASPNIAFRAIAFTGLSAGVTNSLSYNWSVDPVNGSVDILRLQILFRYALGNGDPKIRSFDDLKTKLADTGYFDPSHQKTIDRKNALKALMATYPSLPDPHFVDIDGPACSPPDLLTNNGLPQLHRLCFRARGAQNDSPALTGVAVKSRLVLWSMLIPELSQYVGQVGASNGGSSKLSIPANQSPPGTH